MEGFLLGTTLGKPCWKVLKGSILFLSSRLPSPKRSQKTMQHWQRDLIRTCSQLQKPLCPLELKTSLPQWETLGWQRSTSKGFCHNKRPTRKYSPWLQAKETSPKCSPETSFTHTVVPGVRSGEIPSAPSGTTSRKQWEPQKNEI